MIAETAPVELKNLARQFLELQQGRHQQNQIHRPYFACLAHQYGLTHQEIGDAYGMTEAGVRKMLKRAVK
ncbi:sigma-70 family RNA polymerase sigma factor [Arthrobacter roseus]|uniref:sigma-70 family RNA polymerase sigma factor n=1 Tax=Arthrobacter roseus TaxID=136274 RepID=UPI00196367F4|nr:sigma-70 family RNA polymerase sigma factor [Arthrobacter roseus]MBM7847484.1 DNA-binding transcriptional regulator LsrR (DeoR family) [Arthrobacter roseus]